MHNEACSNQVKAAKNRRSNLPSQTKHIPETNLSLKVVQALQLTLKKRKYCLKPPVQT